MANGVDTQRRDAASNFYGKLIMFCFMHARGYYSIEGHHP